MDRNVTIGPGVSFRIAGTDADEYLNRLYKVFPEIDPDRDRRVRKVSVHLDR